MSQTIAKEVTSHEFAYNEIVSHNIRSMGGSLFSLLALIRELISQYSNTRGVISITRQWCFFHWQRWHIFTARHGGFIVKRAFDMTVASIVMVLLSPLFLLVVLVIRLDSPGPILFSQDRIGKNGRTFKMWKFRSMYIDAEQRKAELMKHNQMQGGVLFKMKDDPRVTRVGKFIRKFSIDELPQFQNVFLGDMSLVGPRPPVPSEVAQYMPYQRQRLEATPGITCIWQVSGRSEISFAQQVEMDVEYISTRSFWKDIALLFKTVPAVLSARGAY
jgi:exopolysaccharide biosynthesis polyprenyl glycosylphosphotransferase